MEETVDETGDESALGELLDEALTDQSSVTTESDVSFPVPAPRQRQRDQRATASKV